MTPTMERIDFRGLVVRMKRRPLLCVRGAAPSLEAVGSDEAAV